MDDWLMSDGDEGEASDLDDHLQSSEQTSIASCDNDRALAGIEETIKGITASLLSRSEFSLKLHSRRPNTSQFDPVTSSILPSQPLPSHFAATSFPSSARRFACILFVLEILHANRTSYPRTPLTKRDIYYRNPTLFRNQQTVNSIVDSLAATLEVTRGMLGVSAAAKGLVYGHVLLLADASHAASLLLPGGGLIPSVPATPHPLVRNILVVEKETVFRTFATASSGIPAARILLVTAKGYPDIATRRFLATASVPVHALVDWDPDGVGILATYRFGSSSLAHERLAIRGVHWAGVRMEDLPLGALDDVGIARLSTRDRQRGKALLGRAWMAEVQEWKIEVQRMLFLGVKAEIEAVCGGDFRKRLIASLSENL